MVALVKPVYVLCGLSGAYLELCNFCSEWGALSGTVS